MKLRPTLSCEPMSYKEQVKDNELIAKWRVIREVIVSGQPRTAVAKKFSMHRNTVGGLVNDFLLLIPTSLQQEIRQENGRTKLWLPKVFSPLKKNFSKTKTKKT